MLQLNETNFQREISSGLVLVDFYADWCGPCKMVAPVVAEIAEEREDVKVAKVNVDAAMSVAAAFGIVSIPTLIVFRDGKEVNRIVGYRPKEEILAILG